MTIKKVCALLLLVCFTASLSLPAWGVERRPLPLKDTTLTISTSNSNLPYKDESGKILTAKQMLALTKTGDYKILKEIDKSKKPYWLVKKVPGAGRIMSQPVIITPHN